MGIEGLGNSLRLEKNRTAHPHVLMLASKNCSILSLTQKAILAAHQMKASLPVNAQFLDAINYLLNEPSQYFTLLLASDKQVRYAFWT